MAALWLLSLSARAGTYTPAYTTDGGVSYSSNGGAVQTGNYQTQDNEFGYYARGNYGLGSPGKPNTGTATCSGTVTVSFTWKPAYTGELPPASVILTESCTAQWTVSKLTGATYTGQCNNGLGGTVVSLETASQWGQTCQSTQYTVVSNPGSSFTYKRTPSAGSSGSGYSAISSGSVYASMGYSAAASPVTINLTGQNPTNNQALSGQQITANSTMSSALPSGTKINSYTWSFTGGTGSNPIKNWDPTAPNTTNPTQIVPFTATDLSQTDTTGKGISVAPVSFYDQAADNVTVQCIAAFTLPDGTMGSLTAKSQPVTFLKPTVTMWGVAQGYVQYDSNYAGSGYQTYGLYGNLLGNSTSTNGMIWSNVTVSAPQTYTGTFGGQCTFTQLVNPDRLGYTGNNSTPLVANNGILGLDGSFEYGSTWSVTTAGSDVDSPSQIIGVTGEPVTNGGYTEINDTDAFTTYVMYQPPGTNSIWVPLKKFSWTWGVTLNWQNSNSQWSLAASYPATPGSAPTYTPAITDVPPQWTVIH